MFLEAKNWGSIVDVCNNYAPGSPKLISTPRAVANAAEAKPGANNQLLIESTAQLAHQNLTKTEHYNRYFQQVNKLAPLPPCLSLTSKVLCICITKWIFDGAGIHTNHAKERRSSVHVEM